MPIDVFDLVVPTASISSILLCSLAPIYMPRLFVTIFFCYSLYFFHMTLMQFIRYSRAVERIIENVKSARDVEGTGVEVAHTHILVIPNYSEPLQILQKTLEKLSVHSCAASNYIVVLAMEATEAQCSKKAEILAHEFKACFREIIITIHPADVALEARGKGSNVRRACSILTAQGIPMKQMLVTVMDADASLPELYIKSLEKAMLDSPEPYKSVYCPPIFFSRNSMQIPAPVRCTDIVWSVIVTQNLANTRGLLFPCSCYSLTMVLADSVDYWDSDFNAIGEDFHMMLKCFYKADAKAIPIHVPINLTNIQSTSYSSTLYARFTQAKRHALACADAGYALRHTLDTPESSTLSNIRDRVLMALRVLEAFIIPSTSGWFLTLGTAMFNAYISSDEFASEQLVVSLIHACTVLSIISSLPLLACCFLYETYHRFLNSTLYRKGSLFDDGKHNDSPACTRTWRHLMDYIFLPLGAFVFVTLPSSIGCVQRLIPNNGLVYITAAKMAELED